MLKKFSIGFIILFLNLHAENIYEDLRNTIEAEYTDIFKETYTESNGANANTLINIEDEIKNYKKAQDILNKLKEEPNIPDRKRELLEIYQSKWNEIEAYTQIVKKHFGKRNKDKTNMLIIRRESALKECEKILNEIETL